MTELLNRSRGFLYDGCGTCKQLSSLWESHFVGEANILSSEVTRKAAGHVSEPACVKSVLSILTSAGEF